MGDGVPNEETAIEIAEEYAVEECVGQFGEVSAVKERDADWVVEFQTHTYSDAYTHCVTITKAVGNVVSHDRSSRFE